MALLPPFYRIRRGTVRYLFLQYADGYRETEAITRCVNPPVGPFHTASNASIKCICQEIRLSMYLFKASFTLRFSFIRRGTAE